MLPITSLLSVALVGLAKREATPNALVKQHAQKRKWRQTFRRYGALCKEAEQRWKQLALAEPQNMPMHEWSWMPLPPLLSTDPLNMLGAIGCTAAKGGNASGVVQATEALLAAMDECYKEIYARRAPSEVSSIVETQLRRIAVAAEEADSTGSISVRFLDACAEYLGRKGGEHWPLAAPCLFVASTLVAAGERWIVKDKTAIARTPLVIVRLMCEKGVRQWSDGKKNDERFEDHMESLFWYWNLPNLASMMQTLGSAAVNVGDSDYLYRVFDAYGWLGCSALKAGNRDTTAACVRALAQLGREARAKGLECHWDRCAIKPEDHARERIQWILTWISKADPAEQEGFLGICSQGLSRLSGYVTKILLTEEDGKPFFKMVTSKDPHTEGFSSEAGHRELDYSDSKMMKDFELYGFVGGSVMQGPTVPLRVEPTDEANSIGTSNKKEDER